MDQNQYRDALAALGLSQPKAAKVFGANERTSRRWATGQLEIPLVVELSIRLLLAVPAPLRAKMIEEFATRPDRIPFKDPWIALPPSSAVTELAQAMAGFSGATSVDILASEVELADESGQRVSRFGITLKPY